MKLRWLVVYGLGVLLSAAPSLRAAEPYLEFVDGLRRHDYHDFALIYLDKLEKRADVPAEIKEVIPFEKAITLMDGARSGHDLDAQTRQYDQARVFLEQFLKASPNHRLAGKANTELANVIVGKGRVEVLKSKAPGNSGQKGEFQKKARVHFAEARKVFQAAHDRFKEAYDKFDKYYDPVKQKAKHEAREVAYLNYIQAQLNLAVLTYEEAQTHDKGSSENKKLLTEAASAFSMIHTKHRQQLAGLYARMWEAKSFEEQDDLVKAMGIYNELLDHARGEKPSEALKILQDRVRHFRLVCLNREQRKDYAVVIEEAQEWLKKNRGPAANTRTGLGIQWELVRALEFLAKKEQTSEAEKSRMLHQVLAIARSINKYAGEYKDGSTAMIQRLMVELNRDPSDPKDFPTAFGVARNLVLEIPKMTAAIEAATGSERDRLLNDLQPILKEAARVLNIGLSAATPKDDAKEINQARYFLAYVYYNMRETGLDRSYDAAVLAEFIARKLVTSQPERSREAAYLAQAAFIQAYHHPPKDPRAAEAKQAADFQRIIGVCNFITTNWPTHDLAHDSRMALGRVYSEIGQPAQAAEWYTQIPETAAQYLPAQLAAGNAFWSAYLNESIKPEAERKPKEELDGLFKKAQEILQKALAKFEEQLPGEVTQVDEGKLGELTGAKLTYSQILNGTGDYKGALSVLTEGRLSVVSAVAAAGGDEKSRPARGIKSRPFAGAVYQVILRTYVGLQDLDKARETMRELEKIVGTGGGGATLTKIYVDLGKKLQEEVERLQAAKDARLGQVLKSFETFLEDLSKRKEGQDYNSLIWVGETYRSLGEGLQQGDSSKAEGYFGKAAGALQALLDQEASKPGFIPSGGVLGVKLKLVKCKRLQKDFEEAHQQILAILKEKNRALDVQEEAAHLFQDWAGRGELDKWDIAIKGGAENKKSKEDARVWGWFGLAEKLKASLQNNPNPELEQKYLDASYNVADCWLKYADSQSANNARKKLLGEAYRAVGRPALLIPSLGGGESWARFNLLYRRIQQEMLDLGMEQMRGKEVADLERRSLNREERAKADAKQREMQGIDVANADGDPQVDKPKKKPRKKDTKRDDKAKAAPGTGWMAAGAVVVVLVGGAAYFFLAGGKKKKRRPVVAASEPDFEFNEPKPPPAKVKR